MSLVVFAVWYEGIHLEKESLIGLVSLMVLGISGLFYLRERLSGKTPIPPSIYLLLVAIYLATIALALKIAEIYDRMWYIYKDR